MLKWIIALFLMTGAAIAQTSPNWTLGYVPSISEWNNLWASKAQAVNGILTTPTITSPVITLATSTVAALPACSTGLKGTLRYVTDATAPTYNAALTGGGAIIVPVFCNGTAWSSH